MIEAERETPVRRIDETELTERVRHCRASVRAPRVGRHELHQRTHQRLTGDAVVHRTTHLGESHVGESPLGARRHGGKRRRQKQTEAQEVEKSHGIVG